jgi:CubicO group peptidase (beta-lactamase class C family)
MAYANNGYIVAGAMLEAVSGSSWEDLITTHVFKPLGLASAGFGPPGTPGKLDQPVGHAGPTPFPPGPGKTADNPVALGPAGRVHMNLRDLCAYLDAHLRQPDGFLKPDSWKTLHTPPFEGTYAMGWIAEGGRLWHNGSNTLWYSEMCVDTVKGAVAAVACNQGNTVESRPAVAALLQGALLRAAS